LFQRFLTALSNARLAADWIERNHSNLDGTIQTPIIFASNDNDIAMTFKKRFDEGATWEDVRDWILFDCSNESCLRAFDEACTHNNWRVNIALNGYEYISNNCMEWESEVY
jgi:hypothetical protein